MIGISIDVTLLDKKRFKEFTKKNGNKAVYCELILIDTPNGQYGDFVVKQGVTKEERAARVEMPILGNGKILGQSGTQQRRPAAPRAGSPAASSNTPPHDGDDVPF